MTRTLENLTEAEQFFYHHAGFSYDPKVETPEEGKLRCAHELFIAETDARMQGFYFEWSEDDGCAGCDCGSDDCQCSFTGGVVTEDHRPLVCIAYSEPGGEVRASLGGICGADANYRRVVQAEVALEALS